MSNNKIIMHLVRQKNTEKNIKCAPLKKLIFKMNIFIYLIMPNYL